MYLDRLLIQGRGVEIEAQPYLYGVTLLLLASKYDELDDKIPYIKDFRKVSSRSNFTYDQVVQCESKVAHWLDWDLMVISPENFTTTLLTFGVLFSDDQAPPKGETQKYLKSLRMFTEMFTDISLQSMEMQQYEYSIQALGSVVAARKAKGLANPWTERLRRITGYQFEQVESAFRKLYARYEKIQAK